MADISYTRNIHRQVEMKMFFSFIVHVGNKICFMKCYTGNGLAGIGPTQAPHLLAHVGPKWWPPCTHVCQPMWAPLLAHPGPTLAGPCGAPKWCPPCTHVCQPMWAPLLAHPGPTLAGPCRPQEVPTLCPCWPAHMDPTIFPGTKFGGDQGPGGLPKRAPRSDPPWPHMGPW